MHRAHVAVLAAPSALLALAQETVEITGRGDHGIDANFEEVYSVLQRRRRYRRVLQRFSSSRRGQRHSYSVPLIPDIALRVPDGPNAGLHMFDAKFRVHALTDVGLAADDKDADDEKAPERAGSFKRADIYKMHAYHDAIPDARSVWILYPDGEFRFFGVPGGGRLAGGRFLRLRGCRESSTGWARFRWGRSSEGRGAMAAEWRVRAAARYERHWGGCSQGRAEMSTAPSIK